MTVPPRSLGAATRTEHAAGGTSRRRAGGRRPAGYWVVCLCLRQSLVTTCCAAFNYSTHAGGQGGTPLQAQLVEAAALQVQAAAIPVAGHALGIVTRATAAACTPMPLYTSSLGAALYCAGFLAVNLLAAVVLVRRWRPRGPNTLSRPTETGRAPSPERLWTES
mmetsp:Transcript_25459/g.80413  ORF Transcript_25459/g.80413 Transcript_25459/m.80413 type:complete len:164 (+) Transcript_25459:477-968(+)